jgi:hypothetical protein
MIPHGLRFRLGTGLLTCFLPTWLLNRFLLSRLHTLFPKELIPQDTLELDGFLEIIMEWGNLGDVVSSLFFNGLALKHRHFCGRFLVEVAYNQSYLLPHHYTLQPSPIQALAN